jgi:hypothetical protein
LPCWSWWGWWCPRPGAATPAPLTNLAHLDFLGDRVDPPEQAGHTTWRLGQEPEIGVLWTYAEPQADGSYRRLGGGVYDPATGRTFDGINPDRTVNRNSGAESTIHGLLSMLALDAHPAVAARARVAGRQAQVTWQLVEAEAGALTGAAEVVTPAEAWTGESAWSGGAYVRLGPGGRVAGTVDLPVGGGWWLFPVLDRQRVPAGQVATGHRLGGPAAARPDPVPLGHAGRAGARRPS